MTAPTERAAVEAMARADMAAVQRFVARVRSISDDYHPDRGVDAPQALAEMREDLRGALENIDAVLPLAALTTLCPGIGAVLRGETVVVPREATFDMMRAAQAAWLADTQRRTSTLYAAMLAASPYAPTAGGGE